MVTRLHRVATLALACVLASASADPPGQPIGTSVGFNGRLGASAAVLLVNGQLHTLQVGQTVDGVRLVSIGNDTAVVEVGGQRREIAMGAQPANVGGEGGNARQIVIAAGPGGHFTALGAINGHSVQFLVDTGATAVTIAQNEADRLGLHYRDGRPALAQTANGNAQAFLITLDSVRIGGVEVHNIDAVVVASAMPFVLLGNSFLGRFEMRRDNGMLSLVQRY